MKILHFSDTHGLHNEFVNFDVKNIDVVVFSGDATNYRGEYLNESEFYSFLDWYKKIRCKYKIMIAGNHDSYIYHNEFYVRRELNKSNIIYLNKDEVTLNGVKFYGDPTTPLFGNWYFMKSNEDIHKDWEVIPKDVDVLITHGPPYNILDLNVAGFRCGCKKLLNKVIDIQPKVHLFGHIHSNEVYTNNGVVSNESTIFSNASCKIDPIWKLSDNQNVIEI